MVIIRPGSAMSSEAPRNLSAATGSVEKSLSRLSSGSRIVDAADDAGGAAVEMNLAAIIKRLGAVEKNLMNAESFVRVQEDALKTVGDLVTRMGELKTLSLDPTKASSDVANYAKEYWELAAHIRATGQRTFNGIPLFSSTDKEEFLSCQSRQEGGQTIELVLPPLKEPSLLDVFGEHIYKIISGAKYYDDAESDATKLGGHLATITSEEEWKEIVWQLGSADLTKDPLWIGLHQSALGPEPSGGWQWNTKEAYGFQKWEAGQPDNGGNSGGSGLADYLAWNQPRSKCAANGHLGDESVNEVIGGFVLQYTDNSIFPPSVQYKAVDVSSPLTWLQAQDAAYKFDLSQLPAGASMPHLATLKSTAEYDACFAQLSAQGIKANHMLWLGGFQSIPAGVIETKQTAGENWFWVPDQNPNTQNFSGNMSGVTALPNNFISQHSPHREPDDVTSSVVNENVGYISGPYGKWADSVEDPSSKGIKGYLLEKDNDFTKIPLSGILRTLEWVAHYRAHCGAESMQIQIAADSTRVASVNLESARSKIADVDVASETVSLTRSKVLVESGAKMLQSAHDAMQVVLKLLQPGGSGG